MWVLFGEIVFLKQQPAGNVHFPYYFLYLPELQGFLFMWKRYLSVPWSSGDKKPSDPCEIFMATPATLS